MELIIPDLLSKRLQEIGEIGDSNAYLVGGSVRDLLLQRPTSDIDIVVEGNAIAVANEAKTRWNGTIQIHNQFGTATVTTADPNYPKIDFVSSRRETYKIQGTLPKVESGTLNDDLLRRDFSINALAMRIDSQEIGTIIDRTGGIEDLKTGTIRVLHGNSFSDDPTRIFRACRYAGRYNFHIKESNIPLIQDALPILSQISGERIRNEIDRVLIEENASHIVQLLVEYGIFQTIFKDLKISLSFSFDYQTTQNAIIWASRHLEEELHSANIRWMAFFSLGETQKFSSFQIEAISYRLVLDHQLHRIVSDKEVEIPEGNAEKKLRQVFEKSGYVLSDNTSFDIVNGKWCIVDSDNEKTYVYDEGSIFAIQTPLTTYQNLYEVLGCLSDNLHNSQIYQLLKSFPLETLVLGYSDTTIASIHRENIKQFLFNLRKMQPIVSGDDLIEWGEKPGKNFDSILRDLFSAQLDGKVSSKHDAFTHFQQNEK